MKTDKTDNELIAEFMGLPLTRQVSSFLDGTMKEVSFQSWKYHSSWDWLMPVVEKIETLHNPEDPNREFIVTIEALYCVISENGENPIQECQGGESKIENVYHCIVEFIKWHNQNKDL